MSSHRLRLPKEKMLNQTVGISGTDYEILCQSSDVCAGHHPGELRADAMGPVPALCRIGSCR